MSDTTTVSPLRQRMMEDMAARKLNPNTQRSHIQSCKRFAAWLKRSADTATPDEVRLFQLYLVESGASICNRNRIMTGVRFLFRVTVLIMSLPRGPPCRRPALQSSGRHPATVVAAPWLRPTVPASRHPALHLWSVTPA